MRDAAGLKLGRRRAVCGRHISQPGFQRLDLRDGIQLGRLPPGAMPVPPDARDQRGADGIGGKAQRVHFGAGTSGIRFHRACASASLM